jgi:hypothetical protein
MFKLWKPALFVGAIAVLVIGLLGSGAWFTDTVTSPTSSTSSGTLSLQDAGLTTFDLGTISNMAPGEKTQDVVITIKNDGNINLAWFGNLVITGDPVLQDALYIDYALMQFEGGAWAEPDYNFIANGVGAGPYPGWWNTLASQSPFGVVTLKKFDANNGMGSTPYEFMGALRPNFNYKLTLRFGFAEGAGNEYQGLGPVNLSFQVHATQISAGALNAFEAGFGTTHLVWLNQQIANQIDN